MSWLGGLEDAIFGGGNDDQDQQEASSQEQNYTPDPRVITDDQGNAVASRMSDGNNDGDPNTGDSNGPEPGGGFSKDPRVVTDDSGEAVASKRIVINTDDDDDGGSSGGSSGGSGGGSSSRGSSGRDSDPAPQPSPAQNQPKGGNQGRQDRPSTVNPREGTEKIGQFRSDAPGTEGQLFEVFTGGDAPDTARERLEFEKQERREVRSFIEERRPGLSDPARETAAAVQRDLDKQIDEIDRFQQQIRPGDELRVREDGSFQLSPLYSAAGFDGDGPRAREDEPLARDVAGILNPFMSAERAAAGGQVVQSFSTNVGTFVDSAGTAADVLFNDFIGNEERVQAGRETLKQQGISIGIEASEFEQGMKDFLPFDEVVRDTPVEARERTILPSMTTANVIESAFAGELPFIGTDLQVGVFGAPAAVGVSATQPASVTASELAQGGRVQVEGLLDPEEAAAEIGGEAVTAWLPLSAPITLAAFDRANVPTTQVAAQTDGELLYSPAPAQGRELLLDDVPSLDRLPDRGESNLLPEDDAAGAFVVDDAMVPDTRPQQQSVQLQDEEEAVTYVRALEPDRVGTEQAFTPEEEAILKGRRAPGERVEYGFDDAGAIDRVERTVTPTAQLPGMEVQLPDITTTFEPDTAREARSRRGTARLTRPERPEPIEPDFVDVDAPGPDRFGPETELLDADVETAGPNEILFEDRRTSQRQRDDPMTDFEAREDAAVLPDIDVGIETGPAVIPGMGLDEFQGQRQGQRQQFDQPQLTQQQPQQPEFQFQPLLLDDPFVESEPVPETTSNRSRRTRRVRRPGRRREEEEDFFFDPLGADSDPAEPEFAADPSLTAQLFGIYGDPDDEPGNATGFGLRPLPRDEL